jgi:hypothetical protein
VRRLLETSFGDQENGHISFMISGIGHFPTAVPAPGAAGLSDRLRPDGNVAPHDVGGNPSDTMTRQTESDQELTESEKQQVQKLKQRDQEVRAHERAHMAAGAGLVQGGASFSMQRGPDGRMYAVGGEVKIDTSAENDPDATIRKMQQVKRAALAPAEPSGTDRAVAAQAGQVEAQARQEKNDLEKVERDDERADRSTDGEGSTAPGRRPYHTEAIGQALDIVA